MVQFTGSQRVGHDLTTEQQQICMAESLCCSPETITTLSIQNLKCLIKESVTWRPNVLELVVSKSSSRRSLQNTQEREGHPHSSQ